MRKGYENTYALGTMKWEAERQWNSHPSLHIPRGRAVGWVGSVEHRPASNSYASNVRCSAREDQRLVYAAGGVLS